MTLMKKKLFQHAKNFQFLSMKNIFLAIVLISVAVMMTACGAPAGDESQITVNGEQQTITTTTTTDDGEVTTTMTGTAGDESWCPEGGNWNMEMTGEEEATASWKVDKLMTSGEYAGLCHVVYTATSSGETINMDYYFSEDGKTGYYEMEVNGQTFKQEWSSE